MKCDACSECSKQRWHSDEHDCGCADRWAAAPRPEDWVEKADHGRATWEALNASERERVLLGFDEDELP